MKKGCCSDLNKQRDGLGLGVTNAFGERPNGFGYILHAEQIKGAMALNDCESGHEAFKSDTSKYYLG